MKACRHCAEQIQDQARICPHCRRRQGASIVLIVFISFVVLWLVGRTLPQ